ARSRHWDGHWRASCSTLASRDSHNRHGAKSAWTYPRYEGGGSWRAADRAGQEALDWSPRSPTPCTGRLVRQALERLGLGRTLARGRDGRAWRVGRGRASPRPAEMQHDEEPDEGQQSKLVEKKMRNHGVAPSKTG